MRHPNQATLVETFVFLRAPPLAVFSDSIGSLENLNLNTPRPVLCLIYERRRYGKNRPLAGVTDTLFYDVEKRLIIIMLHSIIRVIPRLLPLSILAVSLASCDNNSGCYGCYNGPPTEFSAGVVSADFNGDGFADVVALSTVFPPSGQTPSNVKAYLSTAAGTFAAPAYTADGFNPIYLASADLNGDGLMDLV